MTNPFPQASAPLALALAIGLPVVDPASVGARPAPVGSAQVSRRATRPLIEARALDLPRVSSAKPASASSVAVTATVGYEYPSRLDLTDWRLNPVVASGAFDSQAARAAQRIPFQRPTPLAPQGAPKGARPPQR